MNLKIISGLLVCCWIYLPVYAQQNPNLLVPGNFTAEVSSAQNAAPLKRLFDSRLNQAWETRDGDCEGAWVQMHWTEPQSIQELWIVNKPTPYDLLLDPELRDQIFAIPRTLKLDFSDGSFQQIELREGIYYQIVDLPQPKTVDNLKVTVERVWDTDSISHTGLVKIDAYSRKHTPEFNVEFFQMYDMKEGRPYQSAKITLINPGNDIPKGQLQIRFQGKSFHTIDLEPIPARSVSIQQLWSPAIYEPGSMTFALQRTGTTHFPDWETEALLYDKNYLDGGTFHILSTNHNDLGWLYPQGPTADYRAHELIAPALDLLRDHPEYRYHMESIEYLKEFLVRYPHRRDEITQRMKEGRFTFGASYTQNLPMHVGQEKLIRHFYYGRRWLLENFPGCDTRFYSNVDIPGMTQQFPQILNKCGVDYILQGRFPWGFYYWEGVDGSMVKMHALRYTYSAMLLNPVNHTGWLRFQNIRAPYYQSRQLPKIVPYDFNCDYLPPAPQMIPFVKEQNETMKQFANVWNEHFKTEPNRQITPSTLRFSSPTEVLDDFFGHGELNIETLKGEWPCEHAYYDEPGHREGLKMGRLGHNQLLQAEGLFAWLYSIDSQNPHPQNRFDEGWMANTWPDHGWGGNQGPTTDSNYVESYRKSLSIGTALAHEAGTALASQLPAPDDGRIPIMVYNASSWERNDVVIGQFDYPSEWTGLAITDAHGKSIPYEQIELDTTKHRIQVAFEAREIPPIGYRVYYASNAPAFTEPYTCISADSLENDYLKIRFGKYGIASLYDKIHRKELLRTDKFEAGEIIQLTGNTPAWDATQETTTEDFDRSNLHECQTLRSVESPIRYLVERETHFRHFTLRQRYILPKHARELILETDILNWKGIPNRELRIVFPIEMGQTPRISYEVPFSTVEKGKDEIDYSLLPETIESNFYPQLYGRTDLPFREAINWIDISSGQYQGNGCLLASDMSVHHFRDETDDPETYPLMQHVLLSTRKSISWNPEYWFTQAGNHSYRMALYPHEGNWRMAYRQGQAFNTPLTIYTPNQTHINPESAKLPPSGSLLQTGASNLIVSTVKRAEDGNGLVVRFYEAEGRYSKLALKTLMPIREARLTDMLEYDQKTLPLQNDGSLEISVKPWEIVTLKLWLKQPEK